MATVPNRDPPPAAPFARAARAYRTTLAVQPRAPLLDAREQPIRRRPVGGPQPPMYQAPAAPPSGPQRHKLESPGWTGFSVGFGFAAGAWTFRLITQLVMVVMVILLLVHLFDLLGF